MNKIITISRQFGAGGHSVAKLVAENLGVECYDSIILDKLAEETGFEKEYIKDTGEASLESKLCTTECRKGESKFHSPCIFYHI